MVLLFDFPEKQVTFIFVANCAVQPLNISKQSVNLRCISFEQPVGERDCAMWQALPNVGFHACASEDGLPITSMLWSVVAKGTVLTTGSVRHSFQGHS